MKPMFKLSLLATTVLLAVGCNQSSNAETEVESKTSATTTSSSELKLSTTDEKTAYAMGVNYAAVLKENLESTKEFGISLNNDLVVRGFSDVFAGTEQMTVEDASTELNAFGERVQQAAMEKAMTEAAENKKVGDEFRANYEKEDGVKKTESGLLYKVLQQGNGQMPTDESGVVTHYEGKLINGEVFDSSYERNMPLVFPLNQVIPGWTEALKLMKAGEKIEVVIPPELAYGEQGNQAIPGNSTLIFTIELLDVVSQDKIAEKQQELQEAHMKAEQATTAE